MTLHRQATKVINTYVEHFESDWKKVRAEVMRDIEFLYREGTDGAKLYAQTLDNVYHEMKPKGAK